MEGIYRRAIRVCMWVGEALPDNPQAAQPSPISSPL